MNNSQEEPKTQEEVNAEIARETWDSWIGEMESKEQPTCNSENPEECTSCGS